MISVKDAISLIMGHTCPIEDTEEVHSNSATGRVLAGDIAAPCDLPSFDNAAMDGYAVISRDTAHAARDCPAVLRVIGEVKAGQAPKVTVSSGDAVRIMTGAPMPRGADSVVMVESTDETAEGKVHVFVPARKGDHVRPRGQDVREGQLALREGRPIRPYEAGMLSALGILSVRVYRNPAVGILSTGDEIVDASEELRGGAVRDSSTRMLCASLTGMGIRPASLGRARDTRDSLEASIVDAVNRSLDAFLICGGVSMGKYDLVEEVLSGFGFRQIFHTVAARPGKPLLFGKLGSSIVFGLPGNPVSSAISFEVFVKPCLLRMTHREVAHRAVRAVLECEIRNDTGRTLFVRVVLTRRGAEVRAKPLERQGSGMISSLVGADGFVEVGPEQSLLPAGEHVTVRLLE